MNTPVKDVRARKGHRCSWCGETIPPGELYKNWASLGDDGYITIKMHQECERALRRLSQLDPSDDGYDFYSFTRGCTCESGDSGHGTYRGCVVLPPKPKIPP